MAKISTKDVATAFYESAKSKSGADLERTMTNAVEFLNKHKLLSKASEILWHLEKIHNKDLGVVSATVTSKRPLAKKNLDEIKKILKNRYKALDITLHTHEDLSLIGGIKIEANDEMIDLSLKNKVRQLQNHLLHQHV